MLFPLTAKRSIAEATTELSFDLGSNPFPFRPGQYISITIPSATFPDPRGTMREFSITSSPNHKGTLTVAIRESQSGFKRSIAAVPIGTPLDIEGPFGAFTLPKRAERPLLLVAGGIGVTPFVSMARYATEEKLSHRIVLLYANTSSARAAYLGELKNLAAANPRFTLQEQAGHITVDAIEQSLLGIDGPRVYIAGPPRMVNDVRQTFTKTGIHEDDILFEEFTGYA